MIRKAHAISTGLVGILASGCASLRVDVSVYKGPIVDSVETRLAKAVGLARSMANVADQAAILCNRSDERALLQGLRCAYAKSSIDDMFDSYCRATSQPASAQPTTQSSTEYRECLLQALTTYSLQAQATADRIGVPMLVKVSTPLLDSRRSLLTALVTIDEAGNMINILVSSIRAESNLAGKTDELFLSRINHVMASQAPGTLMTLIKSNWWVRGTIESTYLERFWGEINRIRVNTTGDSMMILAKDQTGNWHLKALKVDPTRVIEAARNVAETALRMIAAAHGIPTPVSRATG